MLPTLAADLHRPWTALIDRAIAHVTHDPRALLLPRLAVSAVAVYLLSRVLYRRMRLPLPVVAALHPIVFMDSACVRWS